MRFGQSWTPGLCFWLVVAQVNGLGAGLRIEVLEGQAAVHRTGSVAYTGARVRIVGDTGRPVLGAKVKFLLPASGATGVFPGGSASEECISDAQGEASVWGIRWGPTPGASAIFVVAQVGESTAGLAIPIQLVALGERPRGAAEAGIARQPDPVPPAMSHEPRASVEQKQGDPKHPGEHLPASPADLSSTSSSARSEFTPHGDAVGQPHHSGANPRRLSKLEPSFEVEILPTRAATPPDVESEATPTRQAQNTKPGFIVSPTREPAGQFAHSRSKWLWIGLSLGGAAAAGLAYRTWHSRSPGVAAPASAVTPALSLSQPIITIGKP
ncbi:MAG: hypothetical protein NZV14_18100 [Bryobacteraceae bacterium]|nr:hypothetical protein [Bryobacteraceae bacterium]MDW8380078.1 hypothetical protein [Bryobacterales bacterium]